MKKLIPLKVASTGIVVILLLVIVFHILVISSIIPFGMVWGGSVENSNQLWLMESISIAVNLIMLLFACAYSGFINIRLNPAVVRIGFVIMFLLFFLNTVGNIFSKNPLETYIFTPVTFLLSLFCLRIATNRSANK